MHENHIVPNHIFNYLIHNFLSNIWYMNGCWLEVCGVWYILDKNNILIQLFRRILNKTFKIKLWDILIRVYWIIWRYLYVTSCPHVKWCNRTVRLCKIKEYFLYFLLVPKLILWLTCSSLFWRVETILSCCFIFLHLLLSFTNCVTFNNCIMVNLWQ